MKKLLGLIIIMLNLASISFGAITGTTDDSTLIGGGARPLGMGRAFVAVSDDSDAALINPAGVAGIKGPQVMTMFTNLMGEVYYDEVTGVIPSNYGVIGVGTVLTGVSKVQVPVGGGYVYADYYDSMTLFSYSTPISRFLEYGNNFFVGVNAKIFNRGWAGGINKSATGYSADIGFKYIINPFLSLGLNRQNILPPSLGGVMKWGGGSEEVFASITKVGIAVKPIMFNNNLLMAFDIDLPAVSTRPITMHAGVEWKTNSIFAVRAGLDQGVDAASLTSTTWNPSAGVSIGYKGFRVDYAYHTYYNDPLLANSYISLSYQWEPTFALKGITQ